jgi:pimeloyl-ACP methyl ester carboxylesterase
VITQFANDGLVFGVDDVGDPAAPAVILLHGFPQDRASWAGVVPHLVRHERRTLAPDLRGYSPGASPRDKRQYALDRIAADVIALADAAGLARFDLAGHDWGAALAFHVAGRYPQRVRTLTALSVPHRGAWAPSALRGTQLWRSKYIALFQLPRLPERVLARGLEGFLLRSGLGAEHARRYGERGRRGELDAALNWYRAMRLTSTFPRVAAPTRFAWGDGDEYVTEGLARSCGAWVDGAYTFEILRGVGHWIPEMQPRLAAELILRPR